MNLYEFLGNTGAEVSRMLDWQKKGNSEQALRSLERALDILDHAIRENPKTTELLRLREVICSIVYEPAAYSVTGAQISSYFLPFGLLARNRK